MLQFLIKLPSKRSNRVRFYCYLHFIFIFTGPVVKVVLNRFTRKNKLIVETIIFEDIIGLFSASLKHSRLNLAESRKILTLMERYNCVNRQYNNTLFMINNCTFYNTATRNFASLPYIDSLRNSKMLKNYLDQFGKSKAVREGIL